MSSRNYFHDIEIRQGDRMTEVYLDGKQLKGVMSIDHIEFFEDCDIMRFTIKCNASMKRNDGSEIDKFTNMRDS